MKRLLSLVAIVALGVAMMPSTGIAGLRGGFDPISAGGFGSIVDGILFGNGLPNGIQTPAARPQPKVAADGLANMERWYAFTTRSQVVGSETSREIWQGLNRTLAGSVVNYIADARSPILRDPSGAVSYADPAWSPNGKYLAYTLTNSQVSEASIVVQEFTVSTNMAASITPVGSPMVVVPGGPGVRNRHPDWSPDGNTLAYDSDVTGTSIDVYTIQVFPTLGSPVRHTFVGNRAEQNPAWDPTGTRIAYDTNHFGPNVIEIVDVTTNAVTLAETNFAPVSHSNPDWSSDGNSIYYDAPENEDPLGNPDIWKLDLPTQAKCALHLDGAGDVGVSVSPHTNVTGGVPFNVVFFESQAFGGSFGSPSLIVWRGNYVQSCVPPLPMAIDIKPSSLNFDTGTNTAINMTGSFPPDVQALGYICTPFNLKGRDGVRCRGPLNGDILNSPLIMGGLSPNFDFHTFLYLDSYSSGSETITWSLPRRTIQARLIALGMVNQTVQIQVDAYSNIAGRQFRGFGFMNVSTSSLAGAVRLEQNAPNPFNPVTRIKFAVSKAGNVSLRVYNVRGELVKTIVDQRYEQGLHEATWDGRNAAGQHVASGVYYAKAAVNGGATDVIKMVMAK